MIHEAFEYSSFAAQYPKTMVYFPTDDHPMWCQQIIDKNLMNGKTKKGYWIPVDDYCSKQKFSVNPLIIAGGMPFLEMKCYDQSNNT